MADGDFGARAVGAIQIIGGGLEVALGVGGVLVPEPATTVGGVILVAHGSDTIVAGFRSLWHGEVHESFTQQGAEAAASAMGASPQTARRIGIGVDIGAGLGPSLTTSITRRLAITGAQQSQTRVAVAYLHRSAFQQGHNAVGVTVNNSTAWFELAGLPQSVFMQRGVPGARYVITELAVTGNQSARALTVTDDLIRAGERTWRTMGPNCTTEALRVLRGAGVVIPEWARSPFLLYTGVRYGAEITVVGGAATTTSPVLLRD